jgi:predicted dehydrogenase
VTSYRIGMVGYKFMGRAHSHAYRDIPMFFPDAPRPILHAVCGREAGPLATAAEVFGVPTFTTDWRELVEADDIDVVDIAAPGDTHHDIAIGAANAGKHVLCEKPLANNLAEAREMLAAVEAAGVNHMVIFNYRYLPAVQLARRIISDGRLGRVYHLRATCLQDWIVDPEFPLVWRLQKDAAGSGALGDLGAHLVDLARFLVGEFIDVTAATQTFVKDRPLPNEASGLSATGGSSGERGEVTVDDAVVFLAHLEGGALGTFEATRFAPGHRATNAFEINGSKGSVRFDFERMNELEVYFTGDPDDVQGFRLINANDAAQPYAGRWWPPGHGIGYDVTFIHQIVDFLTAVEAGKPTAPSFVDGVRCQEVLEAVERSAENRVWVKISDV